MVISGCEINYELEELIGLFIFEAIDEGRVMLFSLPCDQLAEGIAGSFDNLAFISCDLLEDQNLSIARRGNGVGMLFWNRSCDLSGKEGAESGVFVEGIFYFFTVDSVKFGEAFVDGFSEHFGDSHLCNHLGLFCNCGFKSFLNRCFCTLLMKRDLRMVPKFLAKTERRIMGLLSDTFSE